MYNDQPQFDQNQEAPRQPPYSGRRITIPGLHQPVGAGDVVSGFLSGFGIETNQCGGCQKRREAMNRGLQFVPSGWEA